jgi:hypothetical protein
MEKKSKRIRINPPPRIKAELQKEIGSRCPFCPSEDVGHFEYHHINGRSDKTKAENLLMLCRQCHSKFTKKEWNLEEGREKKRALLADVEWKYYQSDGDSFDYTCYDMQQENGRLPNSQGNGSTMNIIVKDRYHFILTLNQNDDRIWKGELIFQQRDYGILFFRYQGESEFEYGRRECFLKQITKDKTREDIIFIKPLTDQKVYGNELVKRKVSVK